MTINTDINAGSNQFSSLLSPLYRETIRSLLVFSSCMIIIGLVMGVIDREIARKIPYSEVPGGYNIEAALSIKILHGHIILLGGVIPLLMALMLFLSRAVGVAEMPEGWLKWSVRLYRIGMAETVLLQFAKGVQFVAFVGDGPDLNFADVDSRLFIDKKIRHSLYGIGHMTAFFGLIGFCFAIAKYSRKAKYD